VRGFGEKSESAGMEKSVGEHTERKRDRKKKKEEKDLE
jgi:hypothetical protein